MLMIKNVKVKQEYKIKTVIKYVLVTILFIIQYMFISKQVFTFLKFFFLMSTINMSHLQDFWPEI